MTELEAVQGIGPAVAKKLKEAYVTTAELLAVQNPVELMKKTKIGEGTSLKIIKNARLLVGRFGFRSGLEIEQEMATKPRLTTGVEKVDKALRGGIEVGSIVEFFGPARGGKTHPGKKGGFHRGRSCQVRGGPCRNGPPLQTQKDLYPDDGRFDPGLSQKGGKRV